MLEQVRQRLSAQSVTLHMTEAARAFLVQAGYSPEYGVRPLRRSIQRLLEDMLATGILNNSFAAGDSVVVDVSGNKLNMYIPAPVEKSAVTIAGKQNRGVA